MDVVTVCPFCLKPVSPHEPHVDAPEGAALKRWHQPCWDLDQADEPIDFAGYEHAERDAAREAAWRARGGRRGAGQ